MNIGIIGLPTAAKQLSSTPLSEGRLKLAPITGTFSVNMGAVSVPDVHVNTLSAMYKPRKTIYAQVQFKDVAGIEGGSSKGSSLSGRLLNKS